MNEDLILQHGLTLDEFKIIKNYLNRDLTMEDVVRKVVETTGIDENSIVGKSRKKEIVEARQTAMYLCRDLLDASLSSVGIHFGGRDHTTVMHAIKAVEQKKKEKAKVSQNISQITSDFNTKFF